MTDVSADPTPSQWTALFAAAERLARARSLDAVVNVVRSAAREIVGADGITFVRREGDHCHYVAEDAIEPLWQGQSFKLSECVSGWAMLHDEPAVIADIYADDRVPHAAYRPTFVKSMAMMPVRADTLRAAIGAYWAKSGTPDPQAIRLLEMLAGFVGAAISNVALQGSFEAANRRFEAAVEAVQGVLWTNTPEGRMEGEQPGWTALTGQTEADYAGYGWSERVHPDDREASIEAWRRAVAARTPYLFEHRLLQRDGQWRHYSIRAVPILDESKVVEQWVGVHTDITEQREAEAALRDLNATLEQRIEERTQEIQAAFDRLEESERRFRILVDGVTDYAIYMLDPEGYITNWNAGAERIKGYSAQEILGRHLSTFYTESDRQAGMPARTLETAGRLGKLEAEGWRVRKDGTEFWANVVVDAIHDEQGRLIGFAKVTRDLTEKRAIEEQLRQSQKMEAVGQLTGGIAHDFNNLLTIISGNMDMAARALDTDEGAGRARRAIENAMKGAERAAALTQRLLAFSRRQPLSPKPLDLDRVVAGMSELLNRSLGELVKLEIVTSPGLWPVEADPNQMESALINLAVNARDAMPSGGMLTIETANAHLDGAYSAAHSEVPPGNYVMIAVSDTGTGMPKEHLARVFEPFFTTKEIGRGTGLGLSQVYGFVKQSGGHVTVYSEEGRGTTVKMYLPRFSGSVEGDEEAELARVEGRAVSGETVLVVEDDEEVRAFSAEVLRELGYDVVEACDGATALHILRDTDRHIDLLFTDVVMPGMSGKELSNEVCKLRPSLKILYTSGYTRNAIVHGGRLDAGVALLPKPFTSRALAERVRVLLDTGGSRRLLVVEGDPTVRLLAVEALTAAGYQPEPAATATEALGKLRAAQGRYDALIIDADLPDKHGRALLKEIRGLYADLPAVLTIPAGDTRPLADKHAVEVEKPFNATMIVAGLGRLGLRG